MLISQKSKKIIDSCRFCWMCRHICPVGNATGQERNTARARALSLSLVERGAEPLEEVSENIYECALCGACTKECVTGWDPVKFTREVRTELALNGKLPHYINRLIENISEYGNVYGKKVICDELIKEIALLPERADTLLFLGCDTIYKSPEAAMRAIRLLKAAGVGFTVMDSEPDSGYAMDFLTGATAETKEIMTVCAKKLSGFKTVIAYDPADAKVFLREYKEWGISTGTRVLTFTSYLADLVRDRKLSPKKSRNTFTFQDPALLSRDIGETEPAREILDACGKRRDMLNSGRDTMLAGNLIMNEYMPGVMRQVAKLRWHNASNIGAEILVTASPAEYEMLNSVKPDNIELKTIEEVLSDACGIK